MDSEKVSQDRRAKQRAIRPGRGREPWHAGEVHVDVAHFWQHAIRLHPDLHPEFETIRGWLPADIARSFGPPPPVRSEQEMAFRQHVAARYRQVYLWLKARYPRLCSYPPHLNNHTGRQQLDNALCAVLTGEDWAMAGASLVEQSTRLIRQLRYPVYGEVWMAQRAAPDDADREPRLWAAGTTGNLTIELDHRMCADAAPVEVCWQRPYFILTANDGFTRQDLKDALERICDRFDQQYPQYDIDGEHGRRKMWRHLPLLYRLWRMYPTNEPVRRDLWQGRPRPISWEDFHAKIMHATSADPDLLFWVEAFPDHWKHGSEKKSTSVDTVRRDTEAAIAWLAPEPDTPTSPSP